MKTILGVVTLLVTLLVVACGEGEHCETWTDCLDSDVAHAVERCAADIVCVQSTCEAACTEGCQIVRDDANPCPEGQLCTQGAGQKDGLCVSHPIECIDATNCPAFRPGDGLWSCESGLCQFPSYSYRGR